MNVLGWQVETWKKYDSKPSFFCVFLTLACGVLLAKSKTIPKITHSKIQSMHPKFIRWTLILALVLHGRREAICVQLSVGRAGILDDLWVVGTLRKFSQRSFLSPTNFVRECPTNWRFLLPWGAKGICAICAWSFGHGWVTRPVLTSVKVSIWMFGVSHVLLP